MKETTTVSSPSKLKIVSSHLINLYIERMIVKNNTNTRTYSYSVLYVTPIQPVNTPHRLHALPEAERFERMKRPDGPNVT